MTKPKKGFAIHCHHDILAEHCYNYQERVDYIKKEKPKEEVKTRLRLFKILPKEALKDIPVYYLKADAERKKAYAERDKADAERKKADAEWVKAYAEWEKADAERDKADAERVKAYAEWVKARAEWVKAYAEWVKARAEWTQKQKDAFHQKWCGCSEWDGKKITFAK